MKKRTSSQQSVSITPTHGAQNLALTSAATHNYLHMLKQSSSNYKTSKLISPTGSESLASLLKSSHIRGPYTTKADFTFHSKQAPTGQLLNVTAGSNMQKPFTTATKSLQKSINLRLPAKTLTKSPAQPRNNSESCIKNKHTERAYEIGRNRLLSGSFCTPSNSKPGSKIIDDITNSSPQAGSYPFKHRSMAIIDSIETTAGSSNDKNREQTLNSSLRTSNFDIQDSDKKFLQNPGSTSSNPAITEFFNESFDTFKDYKSESDDSDSKCEDRCSNHPLKRAKYYIQLEDDSQNQYKFCSKCAVTLADLGTKVHEIITSEEELRKSEIEAFLVKLIHSKRNTSNVLESARVKKQDIQEFYASQCEKAEGIVSTLERIILEELNHVRKNIALHRAHVFAEIDTTEQQLQFNFKEIDDMQRDIERNIDNILRHIDLKPFQKIIGAYHDRLFDLDQHLETIRGQKLDILKLPAIKTKHIEAIKPSIFAFLELQTSKTSILKRLDDNSEEMSKSADDLLYQVNKSSLGISFENKDLFESACGSVFETNREPDRFSFAHDQAEMIKAWRKKEDNKAVESKQNDSISTETETTSRTLKTTQMRRGSQQCSNTANTRRTKSVYTLGEDTPLLSLSNQSNRPSPRTNAPLFSRPPSGRNSHQSGQEDSFATSTFEKSSPLFKNEFSSERTTEKYLNLLEKVNINQNKKTVEYSSLLRSNPLLCSNISSDDEETPAAICSTNKSMVENTQRLPSEECQNQEFTSVPMHSSRKICYNLFAKKREVLKAGGKRQTKSQNNSFVYQDINLLPSEATKSLEEDTKLIYCSPNFKDNIEN